MFDPLDKSRNSRPTRLGSSARNAAATTTDADRLSAAVGIAHLGLGAIGVVYAGVGLLTAAAISPVFLIPVAARLITDILSCYAGLLIRDGRRRGALVAILAGVMRAVLLVITASFGITLVLTVVLIGAAVWILPTFTTPEPTRSRS